MPNPPLVLPAHYADWLTHLKQRIAHTQQRAALAVNQELILLYWHRGREIVEQQQQQGWGAKVIAQLAQDLHAAFPDMKGFSRTNLMSMRAFFEAWPDEAIVQQLVGQLPWGHNILLLTKLKDQALRLWYLRHAIEYGWSRNVLLHHISTAAHLRFGNAVTNFQQRLPAPASELAQQTLKDPYLFDFLGVGHDALERDIEEAMTRHVTKLLMELGEGFAFAGRQVHLEVEGQDFYIDLLFYNYRLHRFLVVELKGGGVQAGARRSAELLCHPGRRAPEGRRRSTHHRVNPVQAAKPRGGRIRAAWHDATPWGGGVSSGIAGGSGGLFAHDRTT